MHLFASITSRSETVVSVVTSLVTNGLGNQCRPWPESSQQGRILSLLLAKLAT